MQNEERKGYRNFRTSLDLGMGIFYVLIAIMVINLKYFGSIELDGNYAYVLGGLMLLYGLFRVYRGISAIRNKSKGRL